MPGLLLSKQEIDRWDNGLSLNLRLSAASTLLVPHVKSETCTEHSKCKVVHTYAYQLQYCHLIL